jgi:catalase
VDGAESAKGLAKHPDAFEFVSEAYKHAKAIAVSGTGKELLRGITPDEAVIVGNRGESAKTATQFLQAIAKHRNWEREQKLRPDL